MYVRRIEAGKWGVFSCEEIDVSSVRRPNCQIVHGSDAGARQGSRKCGVAIAIDPGVAVEAVVNCAIFCAWGGISGTSEEVKRIGTAGPDAAIVCTVQAIAGERRGKNHIAGIVDARAAAIK